MPSVTLIGTAGAAYALPAEELFVDAESAGSAGQTISILRSDTALVLGGTLVTGTAVCTSPTAGGLTLTPADNTTGRFVTVIGMATSTTTLNFGAGFLSSTAI